MPRSTSHMHPQAQNASNISPLEDSKVSSLTYDTTRLKRLQQLLYGLKSKRGKEIYKTLKSCGEFTGRDKTNVAMVGYANGKIITTGVKRCDNPECPVCARKVAAMKVRKLKKALTAFKLDGGDLAFITITMRPIADTAQSIQEMKAAKAKILKLVENKNRAFDDNQKIMAYATLEKTISSKWAHKDANGDACKSFAYLHTHLHFVVGSKHDAIPMKKLVREIKAVWKKFVDDRDHLYSHLRVTEHQATVKGDGYGFRVDWRDNTDNIAEYLNKVVGGCGQLALEVAQDLTKDGEGYSLYEYLDLLHMDPDNPLFQAHKKNIRIWFQEMFRARRSTMVNIDYWVERFEQLQKGLIEKWLARHDLGPEYYGSAFSVDAMTYQEIDKVWVDDELAALEITEEMRNRKKIVFREDIDCRIYNGLRRMGCESTLEHLFREYHYEHRHDDCYNAFVQANLRFSELSMRRFMNLLSCRGLMRGVRAYQYNKTTYTEG